MLDALHNGRNITLIAPRRMGKTGLIRHVFHKLKSEQSDVITLYVDIYSTQNLTDFVRLFAQSVLGQLDTTPQKAIKRIGQFIRSCRPVFTFDEITGIPKVSVDVAPSQQETTLKEVFDYLASSDKRCYIAIDEFQQIAEYPQKGVEALLRSYMQFLPNVNFIFSGSKQHIMLQMFTSAKRPFFQSTQLLSIGKIDREAYAKFAIDHFAGRGKEIGRDVFDAIYNRYDGHTWYLQCVLNRLYGYDCEVDSELVNEAVNQIIGEFGYYYADLVNAYSTVQVRLLKAIARECCVKEVLGGEFIAKYGLKAASSVNSALKKLIEKELVYQTECGYIIYDRFFGEWLCSNI